MAVYVALSRYKNYAFKVTPLLAYVGFIMEHCPTNIRLLMEHQPPLHPFRLIVLCCSHTREDYR